MDDEEDEYYVHLSPAELRRKRLRAEHMRLRYLEGLNNEKAVPIPSWIDRLAREEKAEAKEMAPSEARAEAMIRHWESDWFDLMVHGESSGED